MHGENLKLMVDYFGRLS